MVIDGLFAPRGVGWASVKQNDKLLFAVVFLSRADLFRVMIANAVGWSAVSFFMSEFSASGPPSPLKSWLSMG